MARSAYDLDSPRDLDWRRLAACGPDSAEWFWIIGRPGRPSLSTDNRMALDLCRRCPVVSDCGRYEHRHPTRDLHIAAGLVWGADGPRLPPKEVRGGR